MNGSALNTDSIEMQFGAIPLTPDHLLGSVSFAIGYVCAQSLFILISVAAFLRYSDHVNVNWLFLFAFLQIGVAIPLHILCAYLTELQFFRNVFSKTHILQVPFVTHFIYSYSCYLAVAYVERHPIITAFSCIVCILALLMVLGMYSPQKKSEKKRNCPFSYMNSVPTPSRGINAAKNITRVTTD